MKTISFPSTEDSPEPRPALLQGSLGAETRPKSGPINPITVHSLLSKMSAMITHDGNVFPCAAMSYASLRLNKGRFNHLLQAVATFTSLSMSNLVFIFIYPSPHDQPPRPAQSSMNRPFSWISFSRGKATTHLVWLLKSTLTVAIPFAESWSKSQMEILVPMGKVGAQPLTHWRITFCPAKSAKWWCSSIESQITNSQNLPLASEDTGKASRNSISGMMRPLVETLKATGKLGPLLELHQKLMV